MTPAERAELVHAKAQKRVAGEPITYTDGDLVVRLTAVRSSGGDDVATEEGGVYVAGRTIHWLIIAADLVDSDGGQVRPQESATITDGGGVIYRIVPLAENIAWRWSGNHRIRYRVQSEEQ